MKQKILKHTCVLVVLSVILTFLAASIVMYQKYNEDLKQSVRDDTIYIQDGIKKMGEEYLNDNPGKETAVRITLLDPYGKVLYDSIEDASKMQSHSDRPEFIEAKKSGYAETTRYSETLSKQNFYCARLLDDGNILRVGRTTDSVFSTMISSLVIMGVLLLMILALAFILVQKQTRDLIEPINTLDLEHPLKEVKYEELRPLLGRVDQQNRQILQQMKELKATEAIRREFTANVSHELKTPLMSISGYAELMMNGMVAPDKQQEFSGRIYHEASRLSALVSDIIQLSRLDEKSSDMPFEKVDIYEMAEDIVVHLERAAEKKSIHLTLSGAKNVTVNGVRQVLYEMLYNIADNAIRYTEKDGEVRLIVGQVGPHAYYRVEDNGIGIPEAEQKRIFERFYRVDKSHSRETGGTGLGLSIVKHGAILHDAKIVLDSEVGKGTKMELVF
nr:ATP-binding protein [uncultured Blautia sp.]